MKDPRVVISISRCLKHEFVKKDPDFRFELQTPSRTRKKRLELVYLSVSKFAVSGQAELGMLKFPGP